MGRTAPNATIQVDHVQFYDAPQDGADGMATYLILIPCDEDPHPCRGIREGEGACSIVCEAHPGLHHHYEGQSFKHGQHGHRPSATQKEVAENRANIWGWDGNRDAPSLTPSFLGVRNEGDYDLGYRVHSYLTGGRLTLCGDSTVRLHPSPVPCTPAPTG